MGAFFVITNWDNRTAGLGHILKTGGGVIMPEKTQRINIQLTEDEEKAFRNQLKQGIFQELYQRELLTKIQLNRLLHIA